jgi:hypothetical protein
MREKMMDASILGPYARALRSRYEALTAMPGATNDYYTKAALISEQAGMTLNCRLTTKFSGRSPAAPACGRPLMEFQPSKS